MRISLIPLYSSATWGAFSWSPTIDKWYKVGHFDDVLRSASRNCKISAILSIRRWLNWFNLTVNTGLIVTPVKASIKGRRYPQNRSSNFVMCAEFSSERSCSRSQDVVELTATGCEETSRWLDRYGTTSLLLLTLEADNELFTHWTNVTVLGRDNVLWDSLRCQKCGQVGLNVGISP